VDSLMIAFSDLLKGFLFMAAKWLLIFMGACLVLRVVFAMWMDCSKDDPGAREFFDGPSQPADAPEATAATSEASIEPPPTAG